MILNRRLQAREKKILGGGSLIFCLLMLLRFYFQPFYARLQKVQKNLPKQEAELRQIVGLGEKYQQLKQENRQLQENLKSKQNQIISYALLEELAKKVGIRPNLKSIHPRSLKEAEFFKEEALEIELVGVTLEQVTRYLYEIESTDPALQTSRIHLQPTGKESSTLNVDFTISIFNETED